MHRSLIPTGTSPLAGILWSRITCTYILKSQSETNYVSDMFVKMTDWRWRREKSSQQCCNGGEGLISVSKYRRINWATLDFVSYYAVTSKSIVMQDISALLINVPNIQYPNKISQPCSFTLFFCVQAPSLKTSTFLLFVARKTWVWTVLQITQFQWNLL
jgi:hypothetical protein